MTRFRTLPWNTVVAFTVALVLGCFDCVAPRVVEANNTAAIIQFINSITLTGRTITPDGNTLEDRALKWLVTQNDPKYQFSPGSTVSNTRLAQRYALATYFLPDSSNSSSDLNQVSNINECLWYQIECSRDNVVISLGNNSTGTGTGHVQYSGYAQGRIPIELGLLSSMRSIYLILFGTLPTTIGKWTDLDSVHVICWLYRSSNATIPASIGDWRNVRNVAFQGNYFTGSLPATIGNWINIQRFSVYNTNFNGTLPSSIGNWTNLESLYLMKNQFSGSLPSTMERWSSLRWFLVRSNPFTGTVPAFLVNVTGLERLSLDDNKFTGSLPMGNWVNLTDFYVRNNSFTGTISSALSTWKSIELTDMSNNNLTGTIPRSLCRNRVSGSKFYADCPNEVACFCCEGCAPPNTNETWEPTQAPVPSAPVPSAPTSPGTCPETDRCGNNGFMLHRTLFSRCIERCTTSKLLLQWRLRRKVWKCGKCKLLGMVRRMFWCCP